MRDGELIDHDRDIDISLWNDQSKKLETAMNLARRSGYRIQVWLYDGSAFKLKLIPYAACRARVIDVNMFSKAGDHAWCPQPVTREDQTRQAIMAKARTAWRRPAEALGFGADLALRVCRNLLVPRVEIDRNPYNRWYAIRTWWIPLRFFGTIEHKSPADVPVPGEWEDYLTLRYGKWRTPDRDWSFARDDGGLAKLPPSCMIR